MRFEDIFKKPGLYRASSFPDGLCLEVDDEFYLYRVQYLSRTDTYPEKSPLKMHKIYLGMDYKFVTTISSLFLKK